MSLEVAALVKIGSDQSRRVIIQALTGVSRLEDGSVLTIPYKFELSLML